MIVTDLEHAAEQIALTPALQKALDFLRQSRGQTLADGRVEIDGEQADALVQSYTTKSAEPKFEAHRKYVDIQYVAAGEEVIGWAFLDRMMVDTPYDEAKDACLGRVPAADLTPEAVQPYLENKNPMGRLCQPEDVAQTAVFLASDAAAYITGQAINISGGSVMH